MVNNYQTYLDLINSDSDNQNGVIFADALIPLQIILLNPRHWVAYTAGSAFTSESPTVVDKLTSPLNNIRSAWEYLETVQSDIQWCDRVWQVGEDTATINSMCEIGSDTGSFAAGSLANKMADKYTDSAIETAAFPNSQEQLNRRIFEQTAIDKGMDPSKVRGTGAQREYVPDYMKGDLCEQPERGARSKPFESDDFSDNGIFFNPTDNGSPNNNNNGGQMNLPNQSSIDQTNEGLDYSSNLDTNSGSNIDDGNIFGQVSNPEVCSSSITADQGTSNSNFPNSTPNNNLGICSASDGLSSTSTSSHKIENIDMCAAKSAEDEFPGWSLFLPDGGSSSSGSLCSAPGGGSIEMGPPPMGPTCSISSGAHADESTLFESYIELLGNCFGDAGGSGGPPPIEMCGAAGFAFATDDP